MLFRSCGPALVLGFWIGQTLQMDYCKTHTAIRLTQVGAEVLLAVGHGQQAGLSASGEDLDQRCFAGLRISAQMAWKRMEEGSRRKNSRQRLSPLLKQRLGALNACGQFPGTLQQTQAALKGIGCVASLVLLLRHLAFERFELLRPRLRHAPTEGQRRLGSPTG